MWEVVEADSIKAALKEGKAQPRDRTRATSNIQIAEIVNKPDFERLSDTSKTMDYGAPTLSSDGVIIGGNGRFEGMTGAYAAGNAAQYKADLIAKSPSMGLDPQQIQSMKAPVLVRRLTQEVDVRKLAIQSNQSAGLELSDMEQAALDAERMKSLDKIEVGEDGSISMAGTNSQNIRNALSDYSTNELGAFITSSGELAQSGLRRIRNAILYRAYGKSETLARLIESPDADLKNVGTALVRASAKIAGVRDSVASGEVAAEYDITDEIQKAIELLSSIRAQGLKTDEYMAQEPMFEGVSSSTKSILVILSENIRSAKAITQFLTDYADYINSVKGAGEVDMFGEVKLPTKDEVIENAARPIRDAKAAAAQSKQEQQPAAGLGEKDGRKSKDQGSDAGSAGKADEVKPEGKKQTVEDRLKAKAKESKPKEGKPKAEKPAKAEKPSKATKASPAKPEKKAVETESKDDGAEPTAIELWEESDDGSGSHIPFDQLSQDAQRDWKIAKKDGYASADLHDKIIEKERNVARKERINAKAKRNEEDGSFRTAKGGKGMALDKLQAIVDGFKGNWANMPDVKVVASDKDLPARLYGQVQREGVEGKIAGAYYKGKVYLVASNISDLKEAVITINHEVAGHFGLRSILGKEHAGIMREIYNSSKSVRVAADKMREKEGLSIEAAVEEVIADSAETGNYPAGVPQSLIQKIYTAIRKFMREVFGVKYISDAEIREIVSNARRYVEKGDVAVGEGGTAAADASIMQARAVSRQTGAATFYSALERAFRSNKTEKMPAAQWKAWLVGNGPKLGVKKSEIEWVGINEWLDLKGDARVTKQEVLDWVAGNRVYVNEVILDGGGQYISDGELRAMLQEKIEMDGIEDMDPILMDRQELIRELGIKRAGGTKYGQSSYVLPGGGSHAEIILTDPSDRTKRYKANDETHFGDLTGGKTIGWLRVNIRKDADGNDVLFIEELQSQRGQDGRDAGFAKPEVSRRDDGQWEISGGSYSELYAPDRFASMAEAKTWARDNFEAPGVPLAPFVEDTQAWTSLLLKRAVAYAQSKGIDRVAWTTGDQQVDRYALSKQIDSLKVTKDGSLYDVTGTKSGDSVIQKSGLDERGLRKTLGKDLADTVISNGGELELTGEEMDVGGKGVRLFYDQTVPSVAKTIAGKSSVQIMDIEGSGQHLGFVIPEALQKQVEEDGLPMFRRKDYESQFSDLPEKVREMALAKGHYSPPTIKERLEALKPKMWLRVVQSVFDKYRPIRDIDPKAYMQIRLSTGPQDGAVSGLLHYGQVFNDDGALNLKKGTKGLLEILKPVGPEVDRFLMWVAANRAEQLKKVDRENFFTDEEIKALTKINEGKTADGKSRAGVYNSVLAEMNALNKSVLDVSLSAGLIDQAAYKRFSSDIWYIPFYRQMGEDGTLSAANTSSAAVGQYLSKSLKGSTRQLNDLMENVLLNWSHILSASMKNQAANTTLKAAADMGDTVAKLTPLGDGKFGTDAAGNKVPLKYAVKTMVGGKESFWEIKDEFLLTALDSVANIPQSSWHMNIAREFKTTLTRFISLSPTFKINNLIRDSIQSVGLSELSYNPVANALGGYKAYKDERAEALVGGGLFAMGNAFDGDQASNVKRMIKQGAKPEDILTTPEKIKAGLKRWQDKYDEVSDAMENSNRLALYQQLRSNGASHLEASYAARDLQDFSLQGSSTIIRTLTQVVPYFNARLQGAYKLGRDGLDPVVQVLSGDADASTRQKAAKFSKVLGAVTLAAVTLYLINKDDEDYDKLEDWQKDSFFWMKIPGADKQWLRIPKPFEMGAFATVMERLTEQMVNDKVEGKVFGQRLKHVLLENLAMNPMPQIFKPVYEIATNEDGFTGRPIESPAVSRLSKENRVNPGTSDLGIGINKINGMFAGAMESLTGGAVKAEDIQMSPIQIDYLIRGYLGWVGSAILTTSNIATAQLKPGESSRFERIDDFLVVGNYIKTAPQAQSKYVTGFYTNAKIAAMVASDFQHHIREGQFEKAQELATEKGGLLALNKLYASVSDTMGKLNQQIKFIEADKDLPGDVKRTEIEKLQQIRVDLAKQIEDSRKDFERGGR